MSEPAKYVVPTDMLTGEWPGMRVYGDMTRVVTLEDALAWVELAVAEEYSRWRKSAEDVLATLDSLEAEYQRGRADERAAIRARVVAEFPHAERILAAIDGPDPATAQQSNMQDGEDKPDFSPQRDGEADHEYLSRSIGRCAVTFDSKRGQNAAAPRTLTADDAGYHSQRCVHCDHIRATHTLTASGCLGHSLPGREGAYCPCSEFIHDGEATPQEVFTVGQRVRVGPRIVGVIDGIGSGTDPWIHVVYEHPSIGASTYHADELAAIDGEATT